MRHCHRSFLGFLVVSLAFAGTAWTADTPPGDLFAAGSATWPANPGYKESQAGGIVTLQVNKQVMWAGQQLLLTTPLDVADHPHLTVQIKTSAPMVLDLYLMDGKTVVNVARRIRAVGEFQEYGYDFAVGKPLDTHHITGLIFCVNGAATSWSGTVQLQQLQLGGHAALLPGIEAVEDQEWYHDTGTHAALLTGIAHVQSFTLAGAERLLSHVSFSPITKGRCTMSFDLVAGATGTAVATLTAAGTDGYAQATRTFAVLVEPNLPPTIDAHEPVTALAGAPCTIRFTGVSDGNSTADQPLTIAATSSDQAVVATADLQASNPHGGRYLYVRCTLKKPGDTTITVLLDDQAGGTSTATASVVIHAVAEWNNPPTLGPIGDQRGFISGGDQQVVLGGISDGDQGRQQLSFSVTSSDSHIIPGATVDYHGGGTAVLHYSPTATPGTARMTVVVTDNGGNAKNNGDQTATQSFTITTRPHPVESCTVDLADAAALAKTLRAEDGIKTACEQDAGAPVLKISCKDKSTFGGLWLTLADMDLSDAPYLSVDVKCDQKIAFNMFFYDGDSRRNDGAQRTTSVGGPDSGWKTVTFDFSGKGQMADSKSQPIKGDYVTTALFNFHPSLSWPFSNWTGTILFRNLRIGKAADVPKRNPIVTIDAIPAQVFKTGSGEQRLTVTGLSVANQQPISLAVSESGDAQLTPTIGAIDHGTAVIDLHAAASGRSTISLTASAPGADPRTYSFTVDVLDPGAPGTVTIDAGKTFQTMRGFGTFFGPDVDIYAKDLGASVMRVGDECDFNPRKDTSDINVLNRQRLDYKAFDFDYFRKMKAAGVETFFFTAWTPPAWQKANFSTNFQGDAAYGSSDECINRLDYDCYEDYAKTLVALVRMFQEEADITLDAISLQNEPSFCEPYGSAILDPKRMVHLIDVVGARFAKEGIPTRLLMPEQVFTQGNMLDYIRVLNADPQAQKYCSIVATHGYDDKGVKAANPDFPGWTAMFNLAQKGTVPKELWMSETYPAYSGWPSAMIYSVSLYGSLEFGNISLWTQWSIEGTLLDRNKPTDSFWVVRQYWNFIRPGAKRVSSASSDGSILATSYLNDAKHGGKLVSVITNHKDAAAVLKLAAVNHPVAAWQVITTDPVRHDAGMAGIGADEALLLPPNSVTTVIER